MANKDKNQDKYSNLIVGFILIGISLTLLLILAGVFNPAGKYVRDFLVGVFGLSIYGITVASLLIGMLKLFSFKVSVPFTRILELIGIYALFILAFHATSYDYVTMTSTYGEYINMCYTTANTAGGVIAAVVMYPLLLVHKVFAIVMVALLLFGLIAFAMFRGKGKYDSMRSRSVKYGSKKNREEDKDHVEVETELKNEDVNGNKLGNIKTRSRFSKTQTEYVPLDETDVEEVNDEEFEVNYKDKYAYDSKTIEKDDDMIIERDNSIRTDEVSGENKFDRMRNEARIARERLYGPDKSGDETHIADSSTSMTDHEKFKEAIEKIRNNEDQSYLYNLTSNKDDYELYSMEARERIYRENMERERQEQLDKDNKVDEKASDNNEEFNVEDFSIDTDDDKGYSFDNFNAFNDTKQDDDMPVIKNAFDRGDAEDDVITDDTTTAEDEPIIDDGDDNSIDTDDNVKDESINYDIDDFSSSLDKTFEIKKNEESKYDLPFYSRDEMYKSDDKAEDKNPKPIEAKKETPKTNDIKASENRVDNIEKELLEDEPKERKRRSDFGGTHNSQRPLDKEIKEAEKAKSQAVEDEVEEEVTTDISSFINPFAAKQAEEKAKAEEEAKAEEIKEAEAPKPYVAELGYKYKAPPIDLLADYKYDEEDDHEELEEQARAIEEGLKEFNIFAKVSNITKGPTFTRFELTMDRGMGKSVKTIKTLADDIRYWLGSEGGINIQAPIPGKSAIGIEVGNKKRRTVGFKEVLNSELFNSKKWRIPFALGVDIDNIAHVCDVAKAPHLLVAGSTGSGKSVGIASLLNGILYKCSPNDVKFILVDPKKVELNDYRDLPHMLVKDPITEPHQVANVLDWLIDEMERRYDALCEVHVSNLDEYNEWADEHNQPRMPYILLVVDEVADLMSVLKKNLEDRISRLAAKSRAAGIHMVLATQRPSVDVITGTIKSNLPSRIAFAASQAVDSKTILDQIGAEKLLGLGDMLYKDAKSDNLQRIQGAFISKKEVVAITNYVREHNKSEYDSSIQEFIDHDESKEEEETSSNREASKPSGEMQIDELFKDALEIFINANKATVTLLQRKLGIGYPRAAKIYDQIAECGFINDKTVLITHMQFMQMFGDDNNGEEN